MKNDYTSPDFKKWLDLLQQESWQLELIISGFAIYGLILASEPLGVELVSAMATEKMLNMLFLSIVITAVQILIFNLVIHVILRGLWIGAIGLRYVSGEIDFDKLNYSDKFTNYLKRKVGSFDKYIAKLENYCSILFALSFLMIFYVMAYFLVIYIAAGVIFLLKESGLPNVVAKVISVIFALLVLFGALIVFIDFIGQGILKKKKWTSKLYFPIYWVFSYLTLSFLYRPLAYNFLDNKFSRRLSLFVIPFYIFIMLLSAVNYTDSNYLSADMVSSKTYGNEKNYENLMIEDTDFTNVASIPSKVINTPYLKVFVLYLEKTEDFVFEKTPSLEPEEDNRGYGMNFSAATNPLFLAESEDTKTQEYLTTINDIYTLKIDGKPYESDFIVATNAKERLGFETYLNIKNLSEGKHFLTINGPSKNELKINSKTEDKTLVTIPFWYYPE